MYSAQDLAEMFGLSVGTIYKYVTWGIVPKGNGRGRGKHYGARHVAALRAYRREIPERGNRVTLACLAERHLASQ